MYMRYPPSPTLYTPKVMGPTSRSDGPSHLKLMLPQKNDDPAPKSDGSHP
jgi:hypothetical protein